MPITRVTSADVARRAGVSRVSVSKVLNNRTKGQVSEATKRRVEEAAAELGYTRSAIAVSLKRQRTQTVGVITDEIASSPWAGSLLRAISDTALQRGSLVLTLDLGRRGADISPEVLLLRERQVDGIIYATAGLSTFDPPDNLHGVPFVLVNCVTRTATVLRSIIPDDEGGARLAVQRLAEAGHAGVLMLKGSDGYPAEVIREHAARDEARSRGLDFETAESGYDMRTGFDAGLAVLSRPDRPTAIMCQRDRVAAGVLRAADHVGLDVPDQLSVIGFDDEPEFAAFLTPALSTIALPHAEMGRLGATTLLDEIDGVAGAGASAATEPTVVSCVLVERGSVASPATQEARRTGSQ